MVGEITKPVPDHRDGFYILRFPEFVKAASYLAGISGDGMRMEHGTKDRFFCGLCGGTEGFVDVGFMDAFEIHEIRVARYPVGSTEADKDLAAAEATEEAVLRSMLHAHTVTGYSGKVRRSLGEFWKP